MRGHNIYFIKSKKNYHRLNLNSPSYLELCDMRIFNSILVVSGQRESDNDRQMQWNHVIVERFPLHRGSYPGLLGQPVLITLSL